MFILDPSLFSIGRALTSRTQDCKCHHTVLFPSQFFRQLAGLPLLSDALSSVFVVRSASLSFAWSYSVNGLLCRHLHLVFTKDLSVGVSLRFLDIPELVVLVRVKRDAAILWAWGRFEKRAAVVMI